jgi:hypothetical protein
MPAASIAVIRSLAQAGEIALERGAALRQRVRVAGGRRDGRVHEAVLEADHAHAGPP